jgi:hypothetical protein
MNNENNNTELEKLFIKTLRDNCIFTSKPDLKLYATSQEYLPTKVNWDNVVIIANK